MTQAQNHIPQQHSAVSDIVIATLTGALIVLAGLLALSQFAVAFA